MLTKDQKAARRYFYAVRVIGLETVASVIFCCLSILAVINNFWLFPFPVLGIIGIWGNVIFFRGYQLVVGFLESGHWRKENQGHLKLLDENDHVPDLKKLKMATIFSLGGFFLLLFYYVLMLKDDIKFDFDTWTEPATYGYTFMLIFYISFRVFFAYWTLKAIRFVTTYKPFR